MGGRVRSMLNYLSLGVPNMWEETTIKVDFIIYVKPSHMLCIQVQNKWKYLIISCQKVFVKDRLCIEGGSSKCWRRMTKDPEDFNLCAIKTTHMSFHFLKRFLDQLFLLSNDDHIIWELRYGKIKLWSTAEFKLTSDTNHWLTASSPHPYRVI